MVAIAITQKQRNKAKMKETVENKLFYRVKDISSILGLSVSYVYCLLDDKNLNIEQKRLGAHFVNGKKGPIAKSSVRLVTAKGFEQIVNLINEEKI